MEVILDELTAVEFFAHGGIVKVSVNDETLIEECKLKKKYTFFEYKAYIRFFRNLYMTVIQNHPNENQYMLYKKINSGVVLSPSIGQAEYVIDLNYDQVRSYDLAKFYYSNDKREVTTVEPRDPYGIPNVCFSKINENDDRWEKYTQQRLERGFDNSELWSLDGTIAKFIAPRIRAFYEDAKQGSYRPDGISREEWLEALGKIAEGFELMALDREKTEYEEAIECEALGLFSDYFFILWN